MTVDDITQFQDSNSQNESSGITQNGITIIVQSKYANPKDSRTIIHEMGHTLGLVHDKNGLMAPNRDEYRNLHLEKGHTEDIIKSAIEGKPKSEGGIEAGRGFFFMR